MKNNTLFWISGIVLVAVILLFVPSMLMYGRGSWMHRGYGMMGDYIPGTDTNISGCCGFGILSGGWMPFGWIILIAIVILVILAGVWLWRRHASAVTASMSEAQPLTAREGSLEILKRRYAQGEIDHEEFERIKESLSQ